MAQTNGEIIREYSNRPRRYANIDGLFELHCGLWLLGMALVADAGRLAPLAWRPAFVVGVVAWGPVLWFSLRALRRRVTDRRTGYVQLRRHWPSKPHEYVLFWIAMFVYCGILSWLFQFFRSAAIVALCNAALYGLLSRLDRIWKWAILLAMAGGPLILARPGVNLFKQPSIDLPARGALDNRWRDHVFSLSPQLKDGERMTPQEIARRPLAYYNIDGVGELGLGLLFSGTTILEWLHPHLSMIYFGILLAIVHYGGKAIKERITYRRTGFVDYRKWETVWRPALLAAVMPPLLVLALLIAHRLHWKITTPAALYGLFFAAGYAWGVVIWRVPWKWVVAALMTAGSLAIAFLPEDLIVPVVGRSMLGPFQLTFLLCGTLLLISGGITFWYYLRHTHPPAQEAA